MRYKLISEKEISDLERYLNMFRVASRTEVNSLYLCSLLGITSIATSIETRDYVDEEKK